MDVVSGLIFEQKKNDFEKEKKNSIRVFYFCYLNATALFFLADSNKEVFLNGTIIDAVVVVAYKAAENIHVMKEGTWLQ